MRGFSDNDKTTLSNSLMKRYRAIKVDIAKRTQASSLLMASIVGNWPIAVPEMEEREASASSEASRDDEGTIRRSATGFFITHAALATIMHQKSELTAMFQSSKAIFSVYKATKIEKQQTGPAWSSANEREGKRVRKRRRGRINESMEKKAQNEEGQNVLLLVVLQFQFPQQW